MTSCATCARALQPAWKFCIYCGTAAPSVELPIAEDGPAAELEYETPKPVSEVEPEKSEAPIGPEQPLGELVETPLDDDDDDDVEPAPAAFRSRPLPAPVDLAGGFAHFETPEDTRNGDVNDAEAATDLAMPRPSVLLLDPATDTAENTTETTATTETESETKPEDRTGAINVLAIIALALGILLSPLAALFGHFALKQLKTSGEKGVIPAWIAVVLGYLWLGAAIVLGITYLATNA